MKATKMMVLMVAAAIAILAFGAVAYAAPQPGEGSGVLKANLVHEMQDSPAVIGDAAAITTQSAEPGTASDPTDGDVGDEGHAAPAGDETTIGTPPGGEEASTDETQPPVSVLVTQSVPPTRTTETTTPPPVRHPRQPRRPHLAYTGGDQAMYLAGGALILMAAVAVLLIARPKKHENQF